MSGGQDHAVVFRDHDTVIRRQLRPEQAAMTPRQEAALLELVAEVSPVPVPTVLALSADHSSMLQRRIHGIPLLDLLQSMRPRELAAVGDRLGALLASLHTVKRSSLEGLVPVEPLVLEEYHQDARRIFHDVAPHLSRELRESVSAFLAEPLPRAARVLVLCHNDLGAEHVLMTPDRRDVAGVIDWSDASLSDPCLDLGLIFRDLGEAGLTPALAQLDPAVLDAGSYLERIWFYARVRALEDYEFGLTSARPAYLRNALEALWRLFP